ncbi:hypothetical protein STCU_06308 [Strigomonas culicis]|uniref:Uncharacterized protein n=1 Tax=Strigomonas culicis TaxID=28005 RepID=S9VGN6_9TRYP|nr:hypothetical protein STCU_06308 [Strigomonas culicis]|eukprot:EPY26126.1 hypothetical protein STCU_06308 [Strigomonas culicis]
MNAESNCLYTPGCVSALVTNEAELPLWLGRTNAPQQVTLNFPSARAAAEHGERRDLPHALEQLYDTAVAYAGERLPQRAAHRHVVVDAPAPEGELQPGVFYKRLLELVRPSHVVLVAARDAAHETVPGQGSWTSYLQEDVQRLLPDCEFVFVPPQARPCPQSTRPLLLLEYFVGTPLAPLGCSKVVVPLSGAGLQCCSLTATVGADGTVAVQRVQPDRSWRGLVCALSHAETLEEVPLAPVAGQFAVIDVDEASEEMVVIVPAGEEPLQRRLVIVPRAAESDSLRLTEVQIAQLEESVAV